MRKSVGIMGGGPVGCLLGIALKQRGMDVVIYEKRPNSLIEKAPVGRSVNLGISNRGWRALEMAGIKAPIENLTIPMRGRFVHAKDRSTSIVRYSAHQSSNMCSIYREHLQNKLYEMVMRDQVPIEFKTSVEDCDIEAGTVKLSDGRTVKHEVLLSTDGASSKGRKAIQRVTNTTIYSEPMTHGYKEIDVDAGGTPENPWWSMHPCYLHLWPTGSDFFLLGLPNKDYTFTCDFFLRLKGPVSFETIKTDEQWMKFFRENFPDLYDLSKDNIIQNMKEYPLSLLTTSYCSNYVYKDKFALLGDAGHAMTPFFGQGLNCGWEDVRVLVEKLEKYDFNWGKALEEYNSLRVDDGKAMCELALINYLETSSSSIDPVYQVIKKIELNLMEKHPNQFYGTYQRVVHHTNTRYSEAMRIFKHMGQFYEKLRLEHDLLKEWDSPIVEKKILEETRRMTPESL